MSESGRPIVTPEDRSALVREKFPTTFGVIEAPYYRSDFQGGKNPIGRVQMLVQAIWTENDGTTRARVSHPTIGDLNLVLNKQGQVADQQTFNVFKDATLDRVPTESNIRAIVVEVVNSQWHGALDGVSGALQKAGEAKAGIDALQARMDGALTGLSAVARLEASLSGLEAKVGAVVKRADALVEASEAKVAALAKRYDQRIEDLTTANRVLTERLAAQDALLRELLEQESASHAPASPEPDEVAPPDVPLNRKGEVVWTRIDAGNFAQVDSLARHHGLKMPKRGTKLPEVKRYLLAQMKAMPVFTTPDAE